MRNLLVLASLVVAAAACGPKTPKEPPFDADAKSGPDGKRVGARTLRANNAVADSVNFQLQDQTDWYMVQLNGKPGVLTSELNWSNADSDVMIDVFDDQGAQLAASAPKKPGDKAKTLLARIEKPGLFYIRVTAPNKTDGSPYTLIAKWEEPVVDNTPPPEPEQPKKHGKPKEPEAKAEPLPHEKSGDSVQGRIVSAYNDGSALTLHIDKGSAAGIKVGMTGSVLSGPSGEEALDGGDFKVIKVLDANKCLATSSLKSIGRNTRVVITLSR